MFPNKGLLKHVKCPREDCGLGSACFFQHKSPGVDPRPEAGRAIKEGVAKPVAVPSELINSTKRRKLSPVALERASEAVGAGREKSNFETTDQDVSNTERQIVAAVIRNPVDTRYQGVSKSKLDEVKFDPTSKIPHAQRLKFHSLFAKEFARIYKALEDPPDHATAQEEYFKIGCTAATYRVACTNALINLRKRPESTSPEDVGIYPEWKAVVAHEFSWQKLVHSSKDLRDWGYTTEIPQTDAIQNEEGQDRVCDRCGQRFIVSSTPSDWQICTYHAQRSIYRKQGGQRLTSWPCCEQDGCGCRTAKTHVFKITHEPRLAAYQPYRRLPVQQGNALDVVALDCEMVYTTASMELARVSILSANGDTLFDSFVRPAYPVLDFNTTYSGVKPEALLNAITFEAMHAKLISMGLHRETIIVGHGLDNDLTAMRLVHLRVIDSAILFPHPRGRPYRLKLKDLSSRYLARHIQVENNPAGHDPTEDALAALDLVKWRLVHGDATPKIEPFQGKLK
jgi:RNA exonuclease 1